MELLKSSWQREITGISLWICLNIADLVVTKVSMVAMGGGFVEGNPIAALIGENTTGLIIYKLVLTFIVIVLLSHTRKLKILQWLNMVMAAVVGWNLALFCIS